MNLKLLSASAIAVALTAYYAGPAKAEDAAAAIAAAQQASANKDAANNAALQPAAGKADVNARIAKLEEEIALLKRQVEVKDEVQQQAAQKQASVEFNKAGLLVASPDKNFVAKLGGYAQIDTRSYFGDSDRNGKDDILLRSLRPQLNINLYKDWSFFFAPDFGSSGYKLYDAYGQYKYADELQFRFGKFKPPLGLERLESPTDTFFTELGQTSNLVPNRDLGFQIFGELIPDTLQYQIGVFDGGADLGNNDSDDDDSKDIMARVFAQPFRQSDILALQGLGVGVAGSHGNHEGNTTTSILPAYKTPGQNTFFSYRTGAFANGDNWRFVPQAYYYYNNIGVIGEYAVSSQDVRLGATTAAITNHAWELQGAYVLTGEDENYVGSVHPAENFDPKNGTWGAFELVGRLGETDIDKKAFPVFADPTRYAQEAFDIGVGVNWYLNDNIRFSVDYDNTSFDHGRNTNNDREDENALLTRLQYKFQ